jgi:hypothetical protein
LKSATDLRPAAQRLARFHCSRSAGVNGRDLSATIGSSNYLVASTSSFVVISQYGFFFIADHGAATAP